MSKMIRVRTPKETFEIDADTWEIDRDILILKKREYPNPDLTCYNEIAVAVFNSWESFFVVDYIENKGDK